MIPSTPWKVVSFDVGIKNMAYCVFSRDNEDKLEIIDWNVVDLIDAPPQIHKICGVKSNIMPLKISLEKYCPNNPQHSQTISMVYIL